MVNVNTEFQLPLTGKLAIVTGASRGIGEGIAFDLARRGASVILGYTSPNSKSRIDALTQRISSLPHKPAVHPVRADLSRVDGPKELIADLIKWKGDSLRIDILVNNAGVESYQGLKDITVEDFAAIYDLNVRGTLLMTQAVLPYLNANGRIINLSSVAARSGFPNYGLYCSSKAAMEALTRVWAAELGDNGITVNAVSPGPVQTDMLDKIDKDLVARQKAGTPLQHRLGTVQDVADIVGMLAGPDAGWITGQVISATGGCVML